MVAAGKPHHVDEFKAMLAEEWNAGMTASQIAAKHGISRNAVIGLAHRNREMFRGKTRETATIVITTKPAPMRMAKAKPKPKARPIVVELQPRQTRLSEVIDFSTMDGFKILDQEPVKFLDRTSRQCAFPIDGPAEKHGPNMLCCGAHVASGVYCQTHHRISYNGRPGQNLGAAR